VHKKSGRAGAKERYAFRLYVSGATARSLRAVANVKAIFERYLKGHYVLEVLDIHLKPDLVRRDQIVAVPTLVKQRPTPLRLLVGDFTNIEHVLRGLGIAAAS
jgi:circadian clock protein KaiB